MKRALPDYLRYDLDVLMVGINPGLRSAELGHHFAGRGNRFWDLLVDSRLTPRRLGFEDDRRLPHFGIGLTNIASRPTRSVSDLGRRDFDRGRLALARKIRLFSPRSVAFVGVTAYREFRREHRHLQPGRRPERIEGAPVWVLPNPSGRNAHFSYAEMLRHYRAFARWLKRSVARAA
jgi:TDG/mug DNA glycosylase family protein